MSGEMAERLMLAAAGAAAAVSLLLEHVQDAWGDENTPDFSSPELTAQLDAAGHAGGGGFDNCAVCQKIVQALPGAIATMVQQGEEGASGPP